MGAGGSRASDYTATALLGEGSFAMVFLVTEKRTGMEVALKRFLKCELTEGTAYQDVDKEKKVLCSVQSPYVMSIKAAFQTKDYLFFVMPFMACGSLATIQSSAAPLPEDLARFFTAQMTCGLVALHDRSFMHGDLKPANVLLDTKGRVRLGDFGMSTELTEHNGFSAIFARGTEGYQAPEILENKSHGFAVDVWSLGCTLYMLLSSTLPFAHTVDLVSASPLQTIEAASAHAMGLLHALLARAWPERLGCRSPPRVDWKQIQSHPFFASAQAQGAAAIAAAPSPLWPSCLGGGQAKDFRGHPLPADFTLHKPQRALPSLGSRQQKLFRGFNFG